MPNSSPGGRTRAEPRGTHPGRFHGANHVAAPVWLFQLSALMNSQRFRLVNQGKIFLVNLGKSGSMTILVRSLPETREAEKMYIGGGFVDIVLVVLVVLFLVGRI